MSQIVVNGYPDLVSSAIVYDLNESIRAAKYPKAAEITYATPTDVLTTGIERCAQCAIGAGHDNWLCGVRIAFDLTATNKMWVEAERYHFFDIVSSQSTMHKITEFNLDTAYYRYTDERMINIMKELVEDYKKDPTEVNYLKILYSNPAGMRLTARIDTNYRQLKTIYEQRHTHRLPEWRNFCEWIGTLPGYNLIVKDKE